MSAANKALMRRWFEEVWNQGRPDAIPEMLAQDGIVHGLSEDAANPCAAPPDSCPSMRSSARPFPISKSSSKISLPKAIW